MLNNLQDFLDFLGINYEERNKRFMITIEGGSKLFLSKNNNIIKFDFWEYGGNRIIKILIKYITDEDEELLSEFIKVLIEFLNETEGEFFDYSNEGLKDLLESRLSRVFDKNFTIEIIGENPALNFELQEKPYTKEQILDEMDKAVEKGDKEAYYKFQQMLNDIKESYSFKYLSNYKNFEN
jgi:hypothetical protein